MKNDIALTKRLLWLARALEFRILRTPGTSIVRRVVVSEVIEVVNLLLGQHEGEC